MKRQLALLAVLSAAVCATPAVVTPAQAAVSAVTSARAIDAMVIANGVRLRSTPGGSWVVGYLYYGDYGQILSVSSGTWCQFRLGGRSASGLPAGTVGWASCSYFATEDGVRFSRTAVDALGA
ncbi:SH3 domain-containing protein [Streptosporangium sp. NPDC001559]|uniref:SH3 domain-containing protein n=1 Tax=Streptosporangium sp. NPDC001559 TaxID=3366187 RepID=UPI0036ED4C1E